jgi:hypothetical protein
VRLILLDDNTLRILNKYASNVSSPFVEVSSLYHKTFEKFIEVWQKDGNSAVKLKDLNAVTMEYQKFFTCAETEVREKRKRPTFPFR